MNMPRVFFGNASGYFIPPRRTEEHLLTSPAAEVDRLIFAKDHILGCSAFDFLSADRVFDLLLRVFRLKSLMNGVEIRLMRHSASQYKKHADRLWYRP